MGRRWLAQVPKVEVLGEITDGLAAGTERSPKFFSWRPVALDPGNLSESDDEATIIKAGYAQSVISGPRMRVPRGSPPPRISDDPVQTRYVVNHG